NAGGPMARGRPAPALAALNPDGPEGCLGDKIRKGVPNYDLSDAQRTALKAAVKAQAELAKPLPPAEQVVRQMAALNCYACHARGGLGGPTPDRQAYFTMTADFDMGEEGRFAPNLTGAGAKLKPAAIGKIVHEGQLHVRSVLATRMPVFRKEAAGAVVAALPAADAVQVNQPPANNVPAAGDGPRGAWQPGGPPPAFSEASAKDGRALFGVKGLGCVNCHGVLGQKSLGMPAPDLTTAGERLTWPWFTALLHDPNAVNPGTRMPGFWPGGVVALKDVAGGTEAGQYAALYNYLSLGSSMALPAGLAPTKGEELVPADEPVVHRTFFAGVGPRAVLVGYPERVSVAFDANLVRLATVWRGRFFDPKGIWDGRGGDALPPLGTDVLNLPRLGTFAVLPSESAPWPEPAADKSAEKATGKGADKADAGGEAARNLGGKYLGYDLDADRRPTFRYRVGGTGGAGAPGTGGVEVREQPLPKVQPGGTQLVRQFTLTGKIDGLYLLAAQGAKSVEDVGGGAYLIDGKLTVRLPPDVKPILRDAAGGDAPGGGKQLIVPIDLSNGSAALRVEMSW
ncbi:MAG: hypothetical protein JWO31_1436, partial [Phycisphaerales bacterium]|nr:hypothetical protein [Phycisphaerales bacterium]